MSPTIPTLILGLTVLLVGTGLLGTLLGVRGGVEGFSSYTIGLIMSGYYLGYIGGTYLCPGLIRKVGHIRAFAAFAAVGSVATLTYGLVVHPVTWGALRVVSGVCIVGVYMVVESWINEQAAGPHRGRVFALYMASTLVALAAGQFLIVLGELEALLPFAVASMLTTLGLVPIAIAKVREPQPIEKPVLGLQHLYQISPLAFLGALAAGLANSAFWGMGPLFAHGIGLSEAGIAMFMSTTIAGGALLQWPIGHFSDHHDRRTVLVVVSFGAASVALVALGVMERSLLWLSFCAFLYGGLMFSIYALSVAHANDHLVPSEVLEATRGLLLIYGFGALAGPALAGPLMEAYGPQGLPILSAIVLVTLGMFAIFRMTRRAAPPTETQGEFVVMVRTTPVALEMYPEADLEPELNLEPQESQKEA